MPCCKKMERRSPICRLLNHLSRDWLLGLALIGISQEGLSQQPFDAPANFSEFSNQPAVDRTHGSLLTSAISQSTIVSATDPNSTDPSMAGQSAAWWLPAVQSSLRYPPSEFVVPVTLEGLIVQALQHSTQVKVYSDLPIIRGTSIVEAQAAFDSAAFWDTRWDSQSDPVGNTLTTGGAPRYENNQLSTAAGLRKRTSTGGRVELSQRVGFQDTNSNFFVPDPQGTAKLVLNFTQPLMRGRGREYTQSLTVLATIDKDIAEAEFSRQVQSHLLEICRAYWGLFLERSLLVQKRRSAERAEHVQRLLQERASIDAVRPQLQRAAAELAIRQADLVRAGLAVQNAEARIRALVNDPRLGDSMGNLELIPITLPSDQPCEIQLEQSLALAMEKRPEITQAIEQLKAGSVRLQVSKNELMPMLNLVTESYLSGLQGGGSIGDAFTEQFRDGRPSFAVGLQYEIPRGNRAAKSRNQRRQIELRQLQQQFHTTAQTLRLEVEVAVRELQTAHTEMTAQKRAVEASVAQLEFQHRRWELIPDEEGGAALKLDNLLVAQERLAMTENAHTQAWITYNLAMVSHLRATGEMLTANEISWEDYVNDCDRATERRLFKGSINPEFQMLESTAP